MKTQAELGLYGTPAYRCKTRQNGYSLVRDQEVEGSNPSAPTKYLFRINKINVLRSANRRFFSLPQGFSSLDLLVSDQGAGRDLSNLPYKLASRSRAGRDLAFFLPFSRIARSRIVRKLELNWRWFITAGLLARDLWLTRCRESWISSGSY